MRIATFFAVAILASSASAESVSSTRPSECKPVLTIQFRGCRVMTASHCQREDGLIVRLENYGTDGMTHISHETIEGKALAVLYFDGSLFQPNPALSKSTTTAEFLANGEGTVSQVGQVVGPGINVPQAHLFKFVRSGEVEISGGQLPVFDMTGIVDYDFSRAKLTGKAYFHEEIGILFEGETTFELPGEEPVATGTTPVAIIHPGEPGFDSNAPELDCVQMSNLNTFRPRNSA